MRDFEEYTRKQSDSHIFKRLLGYAGPFKKNFIIALALILIDVGLSSISPMLLGFIIRVIGNETFTNNQKFIYIGLIILAMLIAVGSAVVMVYFQQILLQDAGQQIVKQLRKEVFEHIEKLSLNQFNQIPIGKLITRVTNDTNTLSEMYTSVLVNLIRNTLLMIVQFIIMLIFNVKITLIMGITLPFVAIITFGYRAIARKQYRRVRNRNTEINAYLQENLSGIKLTQIFNPEVRKKEEFTINNKNLRREHLREMMMFAVYRPVMYFLGIEIIKAIEAGATKDQLVALAAVLVTMYTYANDFYRPLQNLSENFNVLQSSFASSEKIFDVLGTVPEIVDSEGAIELKDFKGEIEFKNVWFYYVKDEWVLKDVSFKINANETIAFVGATGSGKTTIMNLIVRNYDIIKGQILIDGIDIKKIKLDSLRSEI